MRAAAEQAWPAFVLVCGLLLCARAAAEDGVLAAVAAQLERVPGPPVALLAAGLSLVFATTAVLNLDTSATFLTGVLVLAARRRGTDERPFLFGALAMTNASSLALPGANLTNLIALHGRHVSGATYVGRYGPMALGVAVVTAAGLASIYARSLRGAPTRPSREPARRPGPVGAVVAVAAGAAVVVLPEPALPVLALGVAAVGALVLSGRLAVRAALRSVDLRVLLALFVVAVLAGALGRAAGDPAGLAHAGALRTTVTATVASVAINNLPAASLLASGPVAHPGALLLGLGVGPNLAVTGSLSAYLWWTAATAVDARPRLRSVSRDGLLLVPLALAAGLLLL